jgi:hypothetical protein
MVNKIGFAILLASGLLIVVIAATLLVANVIESGPAAAFGMLGIGLIAASGTALYPPFSKRR